MAILYTFILTNPSIFQRKRIWDNTVFCITSFILQQNFIHFHICILSIEICLEQWLDITFSSLEGLRGCFLYIAFLPSWKFSNVSKCLHIMFGKPWLDVLWYIDIQMKLFGHNVNGKNFKILKTNALSFNNSWNCDQYYVLPCNNCHTL